MWVCRYASLYFCCAVEEQDNELITLEVIHRFVELLDKYFGSVSHSSPPPLFHLASLFISSFLAISYLTSQQPKTCENLFAFSSFLLYCPSSPLLLSCYSFYACFSLYMSHDAFYLSVLILFAVVHMGFLFSLFNLLYFTFSHLADAFIQSDLQIRKSN